MHAHLKTWVSASKLMVAGALLGGIAVVPVVGWLADLRVRKAPLIVGNAVILSAGMAFPLQRR